jgi:biofilm PGA synthesis protein PgaA
MVRQGVLVLAGAAGLFLSAPGISAPVDPLLAQARAARDAGRPAEAEGLARKGLSASDDPVWPLTLSLILSDQGRSAEALAILSAPHAVPLPADERLAAEAYAHQRGGDDWAAMRAYGELLRLRPGDADVRASLAGLLDRKRGPHGAASLDGVSDRRAADMAAARTRWGAEVRDEDISRRFEGTDRALADLDALLARLGADPAADPALVRRVRLDRMIALRDRVRMAEVVAEGDALQPLPAFADQAYADALLAMSRPADALAAYDRVLAQDRGNIQARYGRVFSLVEAERLDDAIAAADAILAETPRFTGPAGGPKAKPYPEHVYAAALAGEVRLWSNQVAPGFDRVRALAEGAPANASLRRSYAGALAARGWPRAAEAETEIAASLDPESLVTRIGLAETALSRHRLAEAQREADTLAAIAPENTRVARLARDVRAARGWGLEVGVSPVFNQGGGLNGLGREWAADGRLETPDLGGGLRLFGLFQWAEAEPVEGHVSRGRAGGGVAWRGADVAASAWAAESWGKTGGASIGASLSWEAGDQWTLDAEGETFSRQTPLRALHYGIRADSLNAAIRFRRDERLSVFASGGLLAYSDGNDRLSAGLGATTLLLARPHFDLTGRADLYASRNSRPGGPYFAPESDFSASFGLSGQHVGWRRYERSFVQAFSVEFGVYDQQGFDAGWIGVARYEHRWRRDPWTEFVYGLTIDRRIYDGAAERGIALNAGLRQRF